MGDEAKIRITAWLTDPRLLSEAPDADVAESAAAEFNTAHPGYQVEISTHDFRTLPEEVARAAERGEAPDIAEYHFDSTRAAMDTLGPDGKPLYTPFDQAVAGRTEILGEPVVLDDMVPVVRDYFRHAGELMAMPRSASAPVLFANMDILAHAGVAEPPRTWREVTAACQAVAKLPGGPNHGITWPNFPWFFQQAVAQQGGLIADHDNGRSGRAEKVELASSEMLAFVRWWQRLHQDGHFLYTGKIGDFEGCFNAFENGEVALVLSSSVDASHLPDRGERNGFAVRVGPTPYNDEVQFAGCMMGGNTCWLAGGLSPAKQDGALAFLQYLSSPRHAAELAKRHFRVPVTRSAIAVLEGEGWYREHPDHRVAATLLDTTVGSPAVLGPLLGGDADIMAEVTGAMHEVLTGEAEPAARFELATVRAQQILNAYNSYCAGPPRRTPRPRDLAVPGI
ncbi:extracellular solute-binding protein [Streptomyces sp. SID13031]|uniref:extracellular solute-binding protein n=1 Tax=Streptomyces sp. SID13031 TaxID=2706046 RepID=UPI0013C60A52|nr:extracellular solute-binding protein [Streptomyces sp. SID13031]NEA33592.1 extracellular solute-binding protein [Streptomyces sp. SID13031]